jgi:hypothetical protein
VEKERKMLIQNNIGKVGYKPSWFISRKGETVSAATIAASAGWILDENGVVCDFERAEDKARHAEAISAYKREKIATATAAAIAAATFHDTVTAAAIAPAAPATATATATA